MRRRTRHLFLGALCVAIAGLAPAGDAVAEPPGTESVPAGASEWDLVASTVTASDAGIAWTVPSEFDIWTDVYFLAAGATTPVLVTSFEHPSDLEGDHLVRLVGSLVGVPGFASDGTQTSFTLYDVTDGSATEHPVADGELVFGHLTGGDLLVQHDAAVYRRDGETDTLLASGNWGQELDADAAGALLTLTAPLGGEAPLLYVDTAGGTWRTIENADANSIASIDLSADRIAFHIIGFDDLTTVFEPRGGGAQTSVVSQDFGWALAISQDRIALADLGLFVSDLDGTDVATPADLTLAGDSSYVIPLAVAADGRFVVSGETAAGTGIYAADPVTLAVEPVWLFEPSVFNVALSMGHLLAADGLAPGPSVRGNGFPDPGWLDQHGGLATDEATGRVPLLAWRGFFALLRHEPRAVVVDMGSDVYERPAADDVELLSLSSTHVLFSEGGERRLVDLETEAETVVDDDAVLSGPNLYSIDDSGAITRQTPPSAEPTVVRGADDACTPVEVFAFEEWFGWECADGSRHVHNGRTATDVILPQSDGRAELGFGIYVFRVCEDTTCELRAADLSDPDLATTAVTDIAAANDVWALDDTGGKVVWWDGTGNVSVAPVLDNVIPEPPPLPATGLSASGGQGQVALDWTLPEGVVDAEGLMRVNFADYELHMAPGSTPPPSTGTPIAENPWPDYVATDLAPNTTYSFSLFTRNLDGVAGVPVTATVWATSLSTGVTRDVVTFGDEAWLAARLRRADGTTVASQPLELYSRRTGTSAWVYRRTLTTDDDGFVRLLVEPSVHSQYKLRFEGGENLMPSTDATVIDVRRRVAASLVDATIEVADSFDVRGLVRPVNTHRPAVLQRYAGGRWVTVATDALSSDGRFRFVRRAGGAGTFLLRVVSAGDATVDTGVSPTLKLRVRP